jgi:ABC-2 type transport system permease protein
VRSTPQLALRPEGAIAAGVRAAAEAVRIGFAGALASPAGLIGRSLFYVILMVILSSFWDTVARHPAAGALAHAPAAGLALYVGVTEWMTLGVAAIHLRIEDDIRSGAIEAALLRPKPYLVMKLAESFGVCLARLLALGAVALALLALSGRAPPPAPVFAALLLLGPLAALQGTLIMALAGLSALWARRSLAAYLVLQKLSFLLGGLVAPVTLYPPWLAALAKASPFAAQLYWPASLTLEPSPGVFALALTSQLAWLALTGLALAGLWRAALGRILQEGA